MSQHTKESGKISCRKLNQDFTSMVNSFQVSRTTIRTAVNSLVEDGYMTIVRGKGTKVTSTILRCRMSNGMNFTDALNQQGMKTSMQEVRIKKLKPAIEICEQLDIAEDEEIYEIYRVRSADDEPISIHYSYIPCKYIPDYSLKFFRKIQSLYRVLEELYSIRVILVATVGNFTLP